MKLIELFQWDLNKKVPCSFPEAHFACVGSKDALIVKANGGNAQIPNVLLQEGKDIMCWFMEGGAVADSGRIRIITRAKPADYVYTESEVITFESLVAKVEDVIAKANTAADRADTAASKADSSADKANAASDKAAQAEADIKASEARRVEAEQGRAKAEATRAANETKRTETFNTNLVSWNGKVDAACKKATDTASKAAQDAKTATDAAIAKTEQATNAAVAKADKATASATTAANKAEAAVAQLPVPTGNVLKGEAESTFINLHDSWKAPIVKGKVLGQSNQVTTTGKNLLDMREAKATSTYNIGYMPNTLQAGKTYNYSASFVGSYRIGLFAYKTQDVNGENIRVSAAYYQSNMGGSFVAPENIGEYPYLGLCGMDRDASKVLNHPHCFQVEEGSKATALEPYTGGKPSPSPEYPQEITNLNKAEIVVSGKNLFSAPIDVITGNTKEPIYLPKGTYTISVKNDTEWWKTTANTNNIYIHSFKENEFLTGVALQNLVVGQRSYRTFNINKDCEVRFFSYTSWGNNTVSEIQLEAGSTATAYEPYKSKSTVIDLKGNELLSIPGGVKDEVVIDSEGNVSLIKRTKQYSWHCQAIHDGTAKNYAVETVDDIGANYSGLVADKAISATNGQIGTCYVNQRMIYVVVPPTVATTEQANQLYGGMKVIYQLAEPQTIPLGKVELPALPESTSNIWNNGNIPCDVYIQYLKDVNIAYTDLENQIKQITAALSMIDTPTIIPEMAWGTPAAL